MTRRAKALEISVEVAGNDEKETVCGYWQCQALRKPGPWIAMPALFSFINSLLSVYALTRTYILTVHPLYHKRTNIRYAIFKQLIYKRSDHGILLAYLLPLNSNHMLSNYFKIAIRTIKRNRLLSFINIFGLGLSMSVAMMVMIRLQDQLNVDNFHPYPAATFRVLSNYYKKNGEHWKMASTPLPLYDKVKTLTGIEDAVSVYPDLSGKATADGKEIYLNGAYTESSFFSVFGFSLRSGNPSTALRNANAIVLSNNTAERLFGAKDPLGKVIAFESGQNFVVTGVMNEPPGKSHLSFDILAPMAAAEAIHAGKPLDEKLTNWYEFNSAYTYVELKEGVNASAFEKQLESISNQLNKNAEAGKVSFRLQNIRKITPGSELLYNDRSESAWTKFYFEMGIALIILLAASFNYTNLTVARALTRAKEVGVRKINGAARKHIFYQFIVESVTTTLAALVFAWVVLAFIIRYAPFNDGYEFIPSTFKYNSPIIIYSILFALGTGLLAGAAPAWILSSFAPLRVLKNLKTARLFGKVSIQKSLIVFQYSLALIIIIFLTVFYKQFAYMGNADTGFKKENVLMVPLHDLNETLVAQKLASVPGVTGIGAFSGSFGNRFNGMSMDIWMENKQNAKSINYYYATPGFINNLKLSLAAGRNFSSPQLDSERYVLLNEQAVKAMGLKGNDEAIGQQIWINDSSKLEVLGVVKDFHYENAGIPIRPLALRTRPNSYNYLFVNTHAVDKNEVVSQVQATMHDFTPGQKFEAEWLDERIAAGNSQVATISLLGYLAFIAIAIASLGLLGLVIYSVETRRKEISVRKIVGAGEGQLVKLLSESFLWLLIIAGLIAMPIGYIAGRFFLQNFAERVSFGVGSVFGSFLVLLVIGLTVIVSQTYKAAVENPVRSLRAE